MPHPIFIHPPISNSSLPLLPLQPLKMAIVSKDSNPWIFSLKALLLSTAVLTTAVFLKLSVPVAVQFTVSVIPVFWSSLVMWLTPPYLYVVVNGIIITIAASSMYQQKAEQQQPDPVSAPMKIPVDPRTDFGTLSGYNNVVLKNPVEFRSDFSDVLSFDSVVMKSPVSEIRLPRTELEVSVQNVEEKVENNVKEAKEIVSCTPAVASDRDFDEFVINRSTWAPIPRETKEIPSEYSFLTERPPASVRFGHRRTVKASPEAGRTLGVSKPKRRDTLESTWKTITDGRPIPLARHLKKSDTWERHRDHSKTEQQNAQKMKKSETFQDHTNKTNKMHSSLSPSPGSEKLKKEPSLSQDELNRRVEAFIRKFNEDMRLQRQESLNQYKEMVKHG